MPILTAVGLPILAAMVVVLGQTLELLFLMVVLAAQQQMVAVVVVVLA